MLIDDKQVKILDGRIAKLRNRRVKVYRVEDDSWVLVFKRYDPERVERKRRDRISVTTLALSDEALRVVVTAFLDMGREYDRPIRIRG